MKDTLIWFSLKSMQKNLNVQNTEFQIAGATVKVFFDKINKIYYKEEERTLKAFAL